MKLARGFWNDLARVIPCPVRRAALKKLWTTHYLSFGTFPGTANWVRGCYHEPSFEEIFLAACDEAADNYGVESELCAGKWLSFSNTGDSYAETIVFWRGTFRIASWGDIVEREA